MFYGLYYIVNVLFVMVLDFEMIEGIELVVSFLFEEFLVELMGDVIVDDGSF